MEEEIRCNLVDSRMCGGCYHQGKHSHLRCHRWARMANTTDTCPLKKDGQRCTNEFEIVKEQIENRSW